MRMKYAIILFKGGLPGLRRGERECGGGVAFFKGKG